MEQVHVRGIVCRSPRLEWFAAMSIAHGDAGDGPGGGPSATPNSQVQATQTAMTVETHDQPAARRLLLP